MTRRINKVGLDLIKRFEGLRLQAYKCPAGIWTIGYGHTGKDVFPNLTIDEAWANTRLLEDIDTAERFVSNSTITHLTDNQFSALVCLCFNIGAGNFKASALLQLLHKGDLAGVADQFKVWIKSKGKKLPGLVFRRTAERDLFLKP